jgi:hypothetical protein
VDRLKLLGPLGATASEFAQACASMADLCPDLVATAAQRKRGAQDLPVEQRALIDRTGWALGGKGGGGGWPGGLPGERPACWEGRAAEEAACTACMPAAA